MMATITTNSSRFLRLVNVWRSLALRSDTDDIILEILGRFSLEKLYADADKKTYQRLVTSLVVQLNAIYSIQRFSLPAERQQSETNLGFVASWEVVVRSVEFVLQVIVEGREGLWEAQALRDKHLAEMLLASLRLLALHPKAPGAQRVKDRRDRFSRIHRSLERLHDNYPGRKSFLLSVCKEVTHALLTEPSALALPSKLHYELPNLTSEMYPLPECLSAKYVSTIVPQAEHTDRWLSLFLALRDVAHFVVAASVQYTANGETRDVHLLPSSGRTRKAVLASADNLSMPQHFSKVELLATFSDHFKVILLDTPTLAQEQSTASAGAHEYVADALDALCRSLSSRQMLQRVSDRQMTHSISEITKDISMLDDPSGRTLSNYPRVYVLNCSECHIAGDTQLKYMEKLEFPDPGHGAEINLPEDTKCVDCGDTVTVAREISLARRTWALLRPLQSQAESVTAERHLADQFQLTPPMNEPGMSFDSSYVGPYGKSDSMNTEDEEPAPLFSPYARPGFQSPTSPELLHFRSETGPSAGASTGQGYGQSLSPSATVSSDRIPSIAETTWPEPPPPTERSHSTSAAVGTSGQASYDIGYNSSQANQTQIGMLQSTPRAKKSPGKSSSAERKEEKKEGKSFFGLHLPSLSRKDSRSQTIDTSSVSSNTLEQQKLEQIFLKFSQASTTHRSHSSRTVHVHLSSVSTLALFWVQASIQVWDVGTSPPTFTRAISTEANCILAVVGKSYLAYITGPREHKLTLRIVNLMQPDARVAEYHMSSSQWCTSLTMSPHENFVVAGFDNSTIRFFQIGHFGEPREQRLLGRFHDDHPAVQTLSFSSDGLALIASMRSQKTGGTIQVYIWKYPFDEPSEVAACRYHVPLHESEDNGVTSAIFRPKSEVGEALIVITTWTQSGPPILVQPAMGHKVEIKPAPSGRQRRIFSRIQSASFSPSGRELALVNDKGNVYEISQINSSLMQTKKLATSKEFTTKTDSLAMGYMTLHEEESIVLVWAEPGGVAYVKKIPVMHSGEANPPTPGEGAPRATHSELEGDLISPTEKSAETSATFSPMDSKTQLQPPGPVELAATDMSVSFNMRKK